MNAFELGFFSIPVDSLENSKKFYGAVMNWTFNDRDSKFCYIFANGNMIGSLEEAKACQVADSRGPLLFFRADHMEATLMRVVENSGIVLEQMAMDIGARGFTAKIKDPFNNTIAFWSQLN